MLLLQRQTGKEGQYLRPAETRVDLDPGAECVGGIADLALAGKEDQDVAGGFVRKLVNGVAHGIERIAVLFKLVVRINL